MEHTKTFVFLDLETSGLPKYMPVRITEISLVAVAREHILDKHHGTLKENSNVLELLPRVLNKVNFTVYPRKMIHPTASAISGLTNEALQQQKPFDENLHTIISLFIERLERPICLIAHNGSKFDFPILQSELMRVSQNFPSDVFCADSLPGFKELMSSEKLTDDVLADIKPLNSVPTVRPNYMPQCEWSNDELNNELVTLTEVAEKVTGEVDTFNMVDIQTKIKLEMEKIRKENERTPVRSTKSRQPEVPVHHARRQILQEKQPRRKWNLGSVYQTLTRRELSDGHRAENDALALLECVTALGRPFLEWVDRNRVPFQHIKRMW